MNRSLACLPLAALLLAACGDNVVKETLGIDRRAPDEFRVVSRPPLSVPPQFDLRPPGVEGVGNVATRDRAQELILGSQPANTAVGGVSSKNVAKPSGSAADNIFLQKAGADQADPNVKQDLAEKRINDQLKKEEQGFWDKVRPDTTAKEPIVKADKEAERIKKNQEEGKPVNEGKTAETGGGTMSTLERWFGDW